MTMLTAACRCCGRDLVFPEEATLLECGACFTLNTRPRAQGAALDVLRRANQQRIACDFVSAERSYQHVLLDHPDEHEALWGLALCRYGVEYVEDPHTGKRMPTVHFIQRRPMQEDADVLRACALAPAEVGAQYRRDAAYVDDVQHRARLLAKDAQGCDVFICYKASVPGTGEETKDLHRARELFYKLGQQGWRVFFAHDSLQNAAGSSYEAPIYHALTSAKVMLVVCSVGQWLNTSWVRSEWSRFLERLDNSSNCRLIPLLYEGMSPTELPAAFTYRHIEALRMSELDAFEKLKALLEQCAPRAKAGPEKPAVPDHTKALLRTEMALEDGDWERARQISASILDVQPECSQAHLYQLLAKLKLPAMTALAECSVPFECEPAWGRACRFASPEEKPGLMALLAQAQEYRLQHRHQAAPVHSQSAAPASPREGKLILHRKSQLAGAAVKHYIYLDGVKVAEIRVGQSVTLPIRKDCDLSAGAWNIKPQALGCIKAGMITEAQLSIPATFGKPIFQCDILSARPIDD